MNLPRMMLHVSRGVESMSTAPAVTNAKNGVEKGSKGSRFKENLEDSTVLLLARGSGRESCHWSIFPLSFSSRILTWGFNPVSAQSIPP